MHVCATFGKRILRNWIWFVCKFRSSSRFLKLCVQRPVPSLSLRFLLCVSDTMAYKLTLWQTQTCLGAERFERSFRIPYSLSSSFRLWPTQQKRGPLPAHILFIPSHLYTCFYILTVGRNGHNGPRWAQGCRYSD